MRSISSALSIFLRNLFEPKSRDVSENTIIALIVPLCQRASSNIPPFGKGGEGGFQEQVLSYDKQLKILPQHLRKNMTDAENMLRTKLRRKQLKGCPFYRQKIIGKFIVDFYCPKANLVIELDGGQHYSESGQGTLFLRSWE
jgi:hypothetical protein